MIGLLITIIISVILGLASIVLVSFYAGLANSPGCLQCLPLGRGGAVAAFLLNLFFFALAVSLLFGLYVEIHQKEKHEKEEEMNKNNDYSEPEVVVVGKDELDEMIEKEIEEARLDFQVPAVSPAYTKKDLEAIEKVGLWDYMKNTVKARVMAKMQAKYGDSKIALMDKQIQTIKKKNELIDVAVEAIFKKQDLKFQREEKDLEHELKMEKMRQKLDKLKGQSVVEVVDISEEEEVRRIREEVSKKVRKEMMREFWKGVARSESMEDALKFKNKRLSEIEEDDDLSEEEKKAMKEYLEKEFDYIIANMYGEMEDDDP